MFVVINRQGWFLSKESKDTHAIFTSNKQDALLFATREEAYDVASALNARDPFIVTKEYVTKLLEEC